MLTLFVVGEAPVVVGDGKFRVELDGLVIVGNGAVVEDLVLVGDAAVVVGDC